MAMSRFVTLPSVDRGGLISASLPTVMIASFEASMYLFATRETSAAVTFSMPDLFAEGLVGRVVVEDEGVQELVFGFTEFGRSRRVSFEALDLG
jgi:hypothetical protein